MNRYVVLNVGKIHGADGLPQPANLFGEGACPHTNSGSLWDC
jgi:hypothetical protein